MYDDSMMIYLGLCASSIFSLSSLPYFFSLFYSLFYFLFPILFPYSHAIPNGSAGREYLTCAASMPHASCFMPAFQLPMNL